MPESTLVILKPDCVERGLVGTVLQRFENAGLKVTALRLMRASRELADSHYPSSYEWFVEVGNKTLSSYRESGRDPVKDLGTDDPATIGRLVKGWLAAYLTDGPVAVLIVEGPNAISVTRKLIGHTFPSVAAPGTIRGDFGVDSPEYANPEKRPVYNLIHASGNASEAERETSVWTSHL